MISLIICYSIRVRNENKARGQCLARSDPQMVCRRAITILMTDDVQGRQPALLKRASQRLQICAERR